MSKSISNHFLGTTGFIHLYGNELYVFIISASDAEEIIAERVKGLDTREHRIKHKKVLSTKEMKEVSKKIEQRTATMEEYKNYSMTLRLNKNRKAAVEEFWANERLRLICGDTPTRNWTHQQIQEILSGHRPKHKGKTIQGHHTYSVRKHPQLAGKQEVIYPVTFEEHLYEWHGGNFKNSLPGRPIKRKKGI